MDFTNPTRRDVYFLPANGWLVIAYPTDNPGAWLMHCHIAFHVAMGLSVQFIERQSEIILPAQNSEWFNTCNNYGKLSANPWFQLHKLTNSIENYIRNKPVYPQDDSGLKVRGSPLEWPSSPAQLL